MFEPNANASQGREHEGPPHEQGPWARYTVALAGLAALVVVAWVVWNREALAAWREEAGPVPFFAAMAILPAVGVPLTPFFVLAGATFGLRLGLLGSLLALATNLVLSYGIAKTLRTPLARLLKRFNYELPNFGAGDRNAFRFVLAVKFAPGVPACVKNYGLGAAGIPFWLYFGASMAFSGAYGTLLIVAGESLFAHDLRGLIGPGVVVVVLGLGAWLWRRRRKREPLNGEVDGGQPGTSGALDSGSARGGAGPRTQP